MPKSPSAVEVPVKDIFSSSYLFNIPGYQRPYAWTQTQCEELFDDLCEFLRANPEPSAKDHQAQESASTYFLGSIVLIKDKDKPEATVVDGQQRLTTLTLLFACLREVLGIETGKNLSEFIYEPGNPYKKLPDRFRLQLRPIDADFFKKFVQQPNPGIRALLALSPEDRTIDTDAKKNLLANAQLLMQKLQGMTAPEASDLAMLIANRCYLVAVSTPDFGSAFRIFSVLNSRGLDLSPTDILKARLLESVNQEEPDRVDSVTRAWEEMEVDLGREAFFDLFTHIRAIFRKVKAKESLLDELTTDLKKISALHFCESVLPEAKAAFDGIRSADYQNSDFGKSVNVYLTWLNRLDFKDWIPPAIVFWMRSERDGSAMNDFFRDLERLTYSMMIRREPDTARIARFGEITKAIEAGQDLWIGTSPLQLSPPEQWDTYEVLSGDFYLLLKSGAARKSVLLRLDSILAGAEAAYDYPIISVEHVLPQTPSTGSDWVKWFPSIESRAKWTHKLGNLALLTKSNNSAARNWPFPIKKEKYFKRKGVTTMALTMQVLEETEWTPAVVEARQKALLGRLESHWKLENRVSAADWALEEI